MTTASQAVANQRPLIQMIGVQTRLNEQEEQKLLQVLREASTLAAGPEAEAFETEFADFVGSGGAAAVNSCSSALELSATFCNLGAGDEVILPAHTFVASAVPFARSGATLRWADIDPDTRLATAQTIEPLINSRTRVILVVHLYGLTVDMDPILELARKHNLFVVEDCAQANAAHYKGRRVGSMGDFGCFSFHTHKNMNTLGEGGMLTTKDPQHAIAARRMRWMGNWPFEEEREHYWLPAMGNIVEPVPGRWPVNYCMGEPNAAVGRLLLKRIDQINDQRRLQASRFTKALADYPELVFQHVPDDCEHVYHLLPARYDGANGKTRDDLIQVMSTEYNLKAIVQYWPLNRSELFTAFGFSDANVPETDRYFDNMIGFPWWSDMSDTLLDDMIERTKLSLDALRK